MYSISALIKTVKAAPHVEELKIKQLDLKVTGFYRIKKVS